MYEVLRNGGWKRADLHAEMLDGTLAWQINFPNGLYDWGIAQPGEFRKVVECRVIQPRRITKEPAQ